MWHTEYNNKDTVVPVEWNEKWFGQKSSFEYNHDIARIACFFSVAAYSDAEKDVLLKNYSLLGISNKDVELNYNMNYTDQKKKFPVEKSPEIIEESGSKKSLMQRLIASMNEKTSGMVDYAELAFDVHIKDFNDDAFSSKYRNHGISSWNMTEKMKLVPNIQFGFKF